MTETPETRPMFPPGRYGRRRAPTSRARRYVIYSMAVLVVIAGALIALKLYRQYTLAPFQVRVTSVTGLTDHQVTVTFEVRKPPGEPALCTVLAHTRDGQEVGRAQVRVPAGTAEQTIVRVTYTLATTRRPVTGEVSGCGPATREPGRPRALTG